MNCHTASAASELNPVVEVEQDCYAYTDTGNGSSPFWCWGSTTMARHGGNVLVVGTGVIPDTPPLANCSWFLMHRKDGIVEWDCVYRDDDRTREPSPIARFNDGRVFASTNPARHPPEQRRGPAEPRLVQFDASRLHATPATLTPQWPADALFNEHSYRSVAADSANRELLLIQHHLPWTDHDRMCAWWSFLDRNGEWSARGRLEWPWGEDDPKPQRLPLCYSSVALVNRAVYFLGVSDIVEPRPEWREFRRTVSGGAPGECDFRRLFYAWTPDITEKPFSEWKEVASRESTAGDIRPCDLYVAPDGRVHLLWVEAAIDTRLRERFFPEEKQVISLNYTVMNGAEVAERRTLARAEEGKNEDIPTWGRFHVMPQHRLLVVFGRATGPLEQPVFQDLNVMEIKQSGDREEPRRIDLSAPPGIGKLDPDAPAHRRLPTMATIFFTASPRAGTDPSDVLDILWKSPEARKMRYARVRLSGDFHADARAGKRTQNQRHSNP